MRKVNLRFPVWVRPVRSGTATIVHVEPLLFSGPTGSGTTYDAAAGVIAKRARDTIGRFSESPDGQTELLWYQFCPDIYPEVINVAFTQGKTKQEGRILTVRLPLGGNIFVCLPRFGHLWFVLSQAEENGATFLARTISEIKSWRQVRARLDGGHTPNLSEYSEPKGSRLSVIETRAWAKEPWFSFEGGLSFFDQLVALERSFDGEIELKKISEDLCSRSDEGLETPFERDKMVQDLQAEMSSSSGSAVVLLGPRGVGKTTIVHGLAAKVKADSVHLPFAKRPALHHFDPVRVITGMRVIGWWQRRFGAMLDFLAERGRAVSGNHQRDILYTDNPTALLRIGSTGQNSLVLADMLTPYLEQGAFSVLLEAEEEVWEKMLDVSRAFASMFHVFRVPEPDLSAAKRMFIRKAAELERKGISFTPGALAAIPGAVRVSSRGVALPGRWCLPLEQISAAHPGIDLDVTDIHRWAGLETGLGKGFADNRQPLDENVVRSFLDERLIGQEDAKRRLLETIHLVRAGISAPDRPTARLLFTGPTGVGKTEAVKILCSALFGDEKRLVRLDMNEFVDPGAVSRLTGHFYRPEGRLTEAVKANPYCVLLFDEIEKAHPSVHDLLLQVLGEGRLTDGLGKTVDFTHTVCVLTSNLGARVAGRATGFGGDQHDQSDTFLKAVREFFRPEFVNRLDGMVVFTALNRDEIRKIARIHLTSLQTRFGFRSRLTALDVDEQALDWIVEHGYDPAMGGRALKRMVERSVSATVAATLSALPPGQPILLQISVNQDGLNSNVVPLTPVDRVPETSIQRSLEKSETVILPLIEELVETMLEDLDQTVDEAKNPGSGSRRIVLRDRLRVLSEKIQSMASRSGRRSHRGPASIRPVRRRKLPGWDRRDFIPSEVFAHLDLREYFRDTFRGAHSAEVGTSAPFEHALLEMVKLDFLVHHELNSGPANVTIRLDAPGISSRSVGVDFLKSTYTDILGKFDPGLLPTPELEEDSLPRSTEFSDQVHFQHCVPGLEELLVGEEGWHVFLLPDGHREMVRVQIASGNRTPAVFSSRQIVRTYVTPSLTEDGSITDLRTGTASVWTHDEHIWFSWLYAAQDPDMTLWLDDPA